MEKEQLIKIGRAIEYMRIDENYQKSIKVDEIAEYAGLSRKVLNRILTRKMDITLSNLLRKYRLYHAARLLHFDYIPISFIARRCGFENVYFTKEFKKEFGMTPKAFKNITIFDDMPIFKEINGYPLSLEYKVVDDVIIEGYPIKTPKDEVVDLMWNVSYAFRHPDPRIDYSCREKTWGIWWHDEEDDQRLNYLVGHEADENAAKEPGKVRMPIAGGRYAVFSVSRGKDLTQTADNAMEMAWYAFYVWQILNFKETDRWGYTYEMFDEEKVYLYIPLNKGFGGVEIIEEFSSHTIDNIIHYTDEHILDELDLDGFFYHFSKHDAFYREQFSSLYHVSLPDYIYKKRLYVLAQKLYAGEITEKDLRRFYHFDSKKDYEKTFRKKFGVHPEDYSKVDVSLLDLKQYYEENYEYINMEICDIRDIVIYAKTIKSRTDRNSIDQDLPQMTAFWMQNDFECLKGTAYENAEKRISIYQRIQINEIEQSFDYLLGPVALEHQPCPEGLKEIVIKGGKYYVFSCFSKKIEGCNVANDVRMMIRCIDHIWMYENWLRTDFNDRVCFYYYDGNRVYYYVPVLG